jgi:hypothetical protein
MASQIPLPFIPRVKMKPVIRQTPVELPARKAA